jgi:hypothetical protein
VDGGFRDIAPRQSSRAWTSSGLTAEFALWATSGWSPHMIAALKIVMRITQRTYAALLEYMDFPQILDRPIARMRWVIIGILSAQEGAAAARQLPHQLYTTNKTIGIGSKPYRR